MNAKQKAKKLRILPVTAGEIPYKRRDSKFLTSLRFLCEVVGHLSFYILCPTEYSGKSHSQHLNEFIKLSPNGIDISVASFVFMERGQ